jgi:hypothetical protein
LRNQPAEHVPVQVFPPRIARECHIRPHQAAHDVGVKINETGAVEGHPGGQTVGVTLLADGIEDEITAQERDGAAQGFQVVPVAPAGTGINHQAGVTANQFIPKGQIAFDVLDLREALAVRGVMRPPVS